MTNIVIQQLCQRRHYKSIIFWSQSYNNMQSQSSKKKFIKQIKLQGKKEYFPNKYFSPFEFMERFNEEVKKKYDIRVIEVKYIVSKSKGMKNIDEQYSLGNFEIDPTFNNIYDLQDPFMKYILEDIRPLVPPKDFDYSKLELQNQAAKRQEEDKKIQEVDDSIQLLTHIYQTKKDLLNKELRSINSFKMRVDPILKDSQVEVFVKAVMNETIVERLQSDKSGKSPIVVQSLGRQQIRVYLHPVKSDPENIEFLMHLCPITDWSLCAFFPQNSNVTSTSHGVTYWSLRDIDIKAAHMNPSIKVQNKLALHHNKKGAIDGLQVYSFLFNEIVLKAVISLAQIKKIEMSKNTTKDISDRDQVTNQYYLYLTYPPRYYISVMKPDIGCDEGFIRTWERAQNFMFLRNQTIIRDQFFRLYLFSNTVFKIRIGNNADSLNHSQQADEVFATIINKFKGTIDFSIQNKPWDLSKKLSILNTSFKFNSFKQKLEAGFMNSYNPQKTWKLKYLILVLIRYNVITPPEVEKLLSHIQDHQEDLDIYIYIFWQSVSFLGSVNVFNNQYDSYFTYLEKQYSQIKKLQISDITAKISTNTDTIVYVYKAFLTPSGYLYNPPTPQMKGRLLKEYSKHSEHFLRITITDDNEGTLKNQRYITKGALKSYMKSINLIERQYIPLGWSPSQLRSYSIWYVNQYTSGGQRLSREQILSFLGSFDKITNPARKAARIGQAFSASWTYLCKQGQIKQKLIQDDYSSKGYMFTDGIGKISSDLIERISLRLSIRDLSIIQIRYKGAKGIFVVDPKLQKNSMVLRKSMIKYECNHQSAQKYLDILDWNKYKAGFLNRQTIILLKSLGIEDKVFMRRQQEHIQRISNLSFKDCSIFKHMNQDLNTDINNLEPANVTILQLLRAGFKLEEQPFFRGVLETMKKNGYHQLKVKSNIMIEQSARLIGIIDEYNILEEGQVFCTILDSLDLKPRRQNVEGEVIITRNPCLHPADIRKLLCVSQIQISRRFQTRGQNNHFSDIVNCVIFPKKGQIPVTAQISGSDLDGDNFFISWDREMIPKKTDEIYLIDSPLEKKQVKKDEPIKIIPEQYSQMIDFFIEYLNYQKLGQIDNSHLVKADQSENFAKDKICIQLAKIHGKAVDFPKTGYCPPVDPKLLVSSYPDFMEKQQAPEYMSKSILGQLYHDIRYRIENLLNECEAKKSGKIDEAIIQELTSELKKNDKQIISFERDEVKEALQILLDYERELSGLIALVGVDTEYQIYSGNFTIAKDKVKVFGKTRLISTILAIRARYFQQFFASSHLADDKTKYEEAKESELENPECFSSYARRRAILFYLCSYIIKFNGDQTFLNDDNFSHIRNQVLDQYHSMSQQQEGKYCGFVWFVVPKILISQKYRVTRMLYSDLSFEEVEKKEQVKKEDSFDEDEDQLI